jgi:hypothetical protein
VVGCGRPCRGIVSTHEQLILAEGEHCSAVQDTEIADSPLVVAWRRCNNKCSSRRNFRSLEPRRLGISILNASQPINEGNENPLVVKSPELSINGNRGWPLKGG